MTPFLRRIKTSNSNSVCEVHGFLSVLYHVTRCLGGGFGTGGGENALSFPSLHSSISLFLSVIVIQGKEREKKCVLILCIT